MHWFGIYQAISHKVDNLIVVCHPWWAPTGYANIIAADVLVPNRRQIINNRHMLTQLEFMITSSNGNIFRVTGPLCGEFTGHRWIPLTKANDAELWCFLLICAWTKGWVNNRDAGNLRRHHAHYNATVMGNVTWNILRNIVGDVTVQSVNKICWRTIGRSVMRKDKIHFISWWFYIWTMISLSVGAHAQIGRVYSYRVSGKKCDWREVQGMPLHWCKSHNFKG